MNIISFSDFLFEKRSHSETNIDDSFEEFLHKIHNIDTGFKNTFVSFRDNIHVSDINPNNQYNTPTGFYCYPLHKYTQEYNMPEYKFRKLFPFAAGRKYLCFFILNNNEGVFDNNTTFEEIKPYIQKLKDIYVSKGSNTEFFDEYLKTTVSPIFSEITPKNHAHQFWLFLYSLAEKLNIYNKETFITNIYNRIGVKGFIDINGEGYIHSNEPIQAVFFKVKNIGKIYTYKQPNDEYKTIEKLDSLNLNNKKILNLLKSNKGIVRNYTRSIINNKTCDDKLIYTLKDAFDWHDIARYYDLSDEFVYKYEHKLGWGNICRYKKDITDDFIKENKDLINWECLSHNENFISIENIDKYNEYLNFTELLSNAVKQDNEEMKNHIIKNYLHKI